jgi:hypothetical protein
MAQKQAAFLILRGGFCARPIHYGDKLSPNSDIHSKPLIGKVFLVTMDPLQHRLIYI